MISEQHSRDMLRQSPPEDVVAIAANMPYNAVCRRIRAAKTMARDRIVTSISA
jgi:hypothetical protein